MRFRGTVTAVGILLLAAGCASDTPSQSTNPAPSTVTTTSVAPQTTLAGTGPCVPGNPRSGLDLEFETVLQHYNSRNSDGLVALFGGDGPVHDPSVAPGGAGVFANVAEWVAAADTVNDKLTTHGYGMSEPFHLYVDRKNDVLAGSGIDSVFVTLEIWANQDCETRVTSGQVVSNPDACMYGELFGNLQSGCAGPFSPRASHFAAWTGEEVLIVGGESGSTEGGLLTSGLAYDAVAGTWRDLPNLPMPVFQWPVRRSAWTGSELIIVGRNSDPTQAIVAMAYRPATDGWRMLAPLPEERMAIGGVAWTGTELILVGGDLHYPSGEAWAYSPELDEWRRLPDPGFAPTEGVQAIWTGSEVIAFGGYAGPAEVRPAHAYDPNTGEWRELASPPGDQFEQHQLAWTGNQMIVYSGHVGPAHLDHLLLYDPAADAWSQSSPMPILPGERLAGVWTGEELIFWGGYATYGEVPDDDGDHVHGAGAAYNPASDTWRVLAKSPLTDRCDHSATWTGNEMIVFGGIAPCGEPGIVSDGHAAAYNPTTDTWRELGR